MADYYVSSVVGDNSDGLTWATAKTSVAAALALAVDGDTILVDSAHSFNSGSANIIWNAASAASVAIISVNRNGSTTTGYSAWLAGATETVGANTFGFAIAQTGAQNLYIFGMVFVPNTGNSSANIISVCVTAEAVNKNVVLESCTFSVVSTITTNPSLAFGPTSGSAHVMSNITLRNCTINTKNATTGAGIGLRNAKITFVNLTVGYAGANKAAFLFDSFTGVVPSVDIIDSDLSGYEKSGGAYIDLANFRGGDIRFVNCKLSGTPSLTSGTWQTNAVSITLINTDSADTKTVFDFRNRLGTILATTSIYADDGAEMGGVNVGWQIVTTADCDEFEPFITPWIQKWGSSTAAQTQSLELIHDNATDLTNRNLWAEFERVSNASFPQGTLLSVRNSEPFQGTPIDWPNSSTTWTGTGGFANPNKQTVGSGSITPAEVSLLRVRLFVGVASKTLYLDPNLRIA